jgi:hypothetical protein
LKVISTNKSQSSCADGSHATGVIYDGNDRCYAGSLPGNICGDGSDKSSSWCMTGVTPSKTICQSFGNGDDGDTGNSNCTTGTFFTEHTDACNIGSGT